MIFTNTSKYNDDESRQLVLIGIGTLPHADVEVHLKGTLKSAYAGMAYCGVPRIANCDRDSNYLVTLRIGAETFFPTDNRYWITDLRGNRVKVPYGGKSVPLERMDDWREALVYLSAHEFQHIVQFRNKSPLSEIECELAAIRGLKRYREIYVSSQVYLNRK